MDTATRGRLFGSTREGDYIQPEGQSDSRGGIFALGAPFASFLEDRCPNPISALGVPLLPGFFRIVLFDCRNHLILKAENL